MANLTPAPVKLNSSLPNQHHSLCSIYMTDDRSGRDMLTTLHSLPPGHWVIFRHYNHPTRRVLAKEVAAICRRRRLILLIAGDGRLAYDCGANGLHLPGYLLTRASEIHRRPGLIVSAAVHSVRDLRRAEALGADFVLVSPVFETGSHPGAPGIGVFGLREFCRRSSLPVIALGGINNQNRRAIATTGAVGIAAISMFEEAATKSR